MDQLQIGVVGIGHLGTFHARLLNEVEGAKLIGVFDTDQRVCQQKARELGVKCFSNYQELLENVQAVTIATPTTTHSELTLQALQADKHVFVEKPIADQVERAQQIVQMAEQKGKVLQVGHIERFNPAIRVLEDVPINPLFIEAHRLASFNPRGTDVSVIFDLMIHDLDLLLTLVPAPVKNIQASGVGVITRTIDIANTRIEFENGCVANLTASRISAKKMRKMRLFQQDAYISIDFQEGQSEIFYIPSKDQAPFRDGTLAVSLGQIQAGETYKEIKYNRLQRKNMNPLKDELSRFVEAVLNDLPPAVSGQDGLKALQLAQRVLEKIEAHQKVVEAAL